MLVQHRQLDGLDGHSKYGYAKATSDTCTSDKKILNYCTCSIEPGFLINS